MLVHQADTQAVTDIGRVIVTGREAVEIPGLDVLQAFKTSFALQQRPYRVELLKVGVKRIGELG